MSTSTPRNRQPLARILLAVNLLFCLVALGVLDYAAGTDAVLETALNHINGD